MREKTEQRHNSLFNFFTEKEIEVSDILLDLPSLISESESRKKFSFTWGSKRGRSAICSSSSSPYLQRTKGVSETERRPKTKVEAASPSTPLCFSPSESDDKSKYSLKNYSKKRTSEEWLEIVGGLTQSKELLRGEVETVRSYYKKLKAFNLELKAKLKELSSCVEKGKPQLEMSTSLNLGMKLNQHYQIPMFTPQQQFITDQFSIGPLGIPDLNVCVEETFEVGSSQPLDWNRVLEDNRIKAAEARKRRMIKIREMKNSFAAMKIQRCR